MSYDVLPSNQLLMSIPDARMIMHHTIHYNIHFLNFMFKSTLSVCYSTYNALGPFEQCAALLSENMHFILLLIKKH